MSEQIANPLTLVMTIKSQEDFEQLKELLLELQSKPAEHNPITVALNAISTVHFARFVFLSERQLAVITTYDGSFERYIDAFVNKIGKVFDLLLRHVQDAPPLPVELHREEFLAFVRDHDLPCVGQMYAAYPNLGVLDVLTLEKQYATA